MKHLKHISCWKSVLTKWEVVKIIYFTNECFVWVLQTCNCTYYNINSQIIWLIYYRDLQSIVLRDAQIVAFFKCGGKYLLRNYRPIVISKSTEKCIKSRSLPFSITIILWINYGLDSTRQCISGSQMDDLMYSTSCQTRNNW